MPDTTIAHVDTPVLDARTEEALRDEQYRILTESIKDVVWILDLETQRFRYVSPSVEKLLGYTPEEIKAQSLEDSVTLASRALLHELIPHRLEDFLSGAASPDRFYTDEIEQPCKDGTTVWVEVVTGYYRNAQTGHVEVRGVSRDISERRQLAQVSDFLLRCGWSPGEEDFFPALARYLAEILRVDYVCIDRLIGDHLTAETVAVFHDGQVEGNVVYTLQDTPCGDVVGKTICIYHTRVRQLFPQDAALQDLQAEGYAGTTLWSADGRPIGLIALIWRHPLTNIKQVETILHLVAVRAAGELERRQAEAEVRASELKYRSLVENAGEGIYVAQDGIVKFHNARLAAICGYASAEILSRPFSDFVYADDCAQVMQQHHQRLQGHTIPTSACRIRHQSGDTRWVEWTAAPIEWEGQPATLNFLTDITARALAEEARQMSEARFRRLIDSLPSIAVQGYGPDGTIHYWNRANEAIYGFTEEEAMGQNLLDLIIPPEMREPVRAAIEHGAATGEMPPAGELALMHKDGTRVPVYSSHVRVQGVDTVPELFCFDVDISARIRAEAALADEKERLRVTLSSIGDGVIATDTAARIVLMNAVAEELTGWCAADALGRPLPEVFHRKATHVNAQGEDPVSQVLATGALVEGAAHTLLCARDGGEVLIADRGAPIRDHESRIIGVVLVFRDVTQEEHREAELRKAQKLESLGILAGGIAHDFNNLLTGILGNLSLSLLETGAHDKRRPFLTEAEQAALRAKGLTQQLLTFARGGAPVTRLVHLEEVVRTTTVFSCRGSAVACHFTFGPGLWPAQVDEEQIGQVIQNLVINATQAMPNGGTLTVRAENRTLEAPNAWRLAAGPYVQITFRDQGIGMPADLLEKIFDPYYSTKQHGSGLGLAVCYAIVTKHAGHISVASTPGAGSTFTLYLPAVAQTVPPQEVPPLVPTPGGGRILVLDDEEMIRRLMTKMLGALGYQAVAVADGGDALKRYQAAQDTGQPFDAVIMDLTIPGGLGGRETLPRLQALDPGVRAIVSSGYATDPILAHYRDYGFVAMLPKPYRLAEVSAVLAGVLAGGAAGDESAE